MFETTETIVTGQAQKATDLRGVMAMVYVQPSVVLLGLLADRADAVLGLKHLGVRSWLYSVVPPSVAVGVAFDVLFSIGLVGGAVAARVFVSSVSDSFYAACFAVLLLAVVSASIRSKIVERLNFFTLRALLRSFWRSPARVLGISGLGVPHLAWPAVTRQAVRPALAFVELGCWFNDLAFRANLFGYHGSLHGSKRLNHDDLILSTGVIT
jgi:hypothetical protein